MNTVRRLVLTIAIALVVALPSSLALAGGTAPRDILVLGGTGNLGAEIVRRLVDQGDRVTVFTRPGSDRALLQGLRVSYAEGDLLNEADVAAAFKDRRYHSVIVAVRVETGDIHFYEKFLPALTAQAKAAGVTQIIHHSAVGAGRNAEKFSTLGWERVPGLLDRLKDQGVGEDLVRASGVPFTIIRNTRLYPAGTPATGKAELTADDTVISPMTRADLAVLTLGCLDNPKCLGKTWHVRDPSLVWPAPKPTAP